MILACTGDPQVVPGTIGLVYTDLAEITSRLKGQNRDALEGTKFAWKVGDGGMVHVTCPYGKCKYKKKNGTERNETQSERHVVSVCSPFRLMPDADICKTKNAGDIFHQ